MNSRLARVQDRLQNWKFSQALEAAENAPELDENDMNLIRALAATFADVGWALDGVMGTIVGAALETISGPAWEKKYGSDEAP